MSSPLKVGVISDSHHRSDVAKSAINFLKKSGANLLIHAGDIVKVATLKDLKRSLLPYKAVLGNNDSALVRYKKEFNLFNEPYSFEFGGFKFRLAHYPFYLSGGADIFIYGHTHQFCAQICSGSLYINPGEICARKKPKFECVLLECEKIDGKNSFEIHKISSYIDKIQWEREL